MFSNTILKNLLGVGNCGVERVVWDQVGLVFHLKLYKRQANRCGICGSRSQRYDAGWGRRQWRGLDWGTTLVFLEAEAPRVTCKEHGVVVAEVPWACHLSRFTLAFEQQTAWQAQNTPRIAVAQSFRIAWRSVTDIVGRVVARGMELRDPLEGLTKIGIDEISYRKGQKYITLVYDHVGKRLVWAAEGRSQANLAQFFLALGAERCARITHISADGAAWIAGAAAEYCPQAALCLDPFHVVQWANAALDEVRREVWNEARRDGNGKVASNIKGSRWALYHKPQDLSQKQKTQLEAISRTNQPLFTAYLLKEQLREVFHQPTLVEGLERLDDWILSARECDLPSFAKLAGKVSAHHEGIVAALTHKVTNARVESLNTRIRLLVSRSFGFHSAEALISMSMLCFGGYCPALAGRV